MFMAWLESVSSKVIVGQSMGVLGVRKTKHFKSKNLASKHQISKSSTVGLKSSTVGLKKTS